MVALPPSLRTFELQTPEPVPLVSRLLALSEIKLPPGRAAEVGRVLTPAAWVVVCCPPPPGRVCPAGDLS